MGAEWSKLQSSSGSSSAQDNVGIILPAVESVVLGLCLMKVCNGLVVVARADGEATRSSTEGSLEKPLQYLRYSVGYASGSVDWSRRRWRVEYGDG